MYFLISFEKEDKPKDLMVSGTFPQIFEATKAMVCLPRFVRTDGKYRDCDASRQLTALAKKEIFKALEPGNTMISFQRRCH